MDEMDIEKRRALILEEVNKFDKDRMTGQLFQRVKGGYFRKLTDQVESDLDSLQVPQKEELGIKVSRARSLYAAIDAFMESRPELADKISSLVQVMESHPVIKIKVPPEYLDARLQIVNELVPLYVELRLQGFEQRELV